MKLMDLGLRKINFIKKDGYPGDMNSHILCMLTGYANTSLFPSKYHIYKAFYYLCLLKSLKFNTKLLCKEQMFAIITLGMLS